jgi:hypothetical protein
MPAAPPQLPDAVTADRIEEALRLASDDAAVRRFLDAYVVQGRAGWGNGPLLGRFSTPYSRVVEAARAARQQKKAFAASDVSPDLTAPEVHVIVSSDVASTDDTARATMRSMTIVVRGGQAPTDRIGPLRTMPLSQEYRDRYGVTVAGTGVIGIFPLTALRPGSELVVSFDRPARGSTAMSSCKDCTVQFDIAKLR